MTRVTIFVSALVIALVVALSGTTAAQTDTRDRTFLTFSGAVDMPGVTLPAGTYVFKLADTPSRNVVQVWDREEKKMIGHWLFVQADRPEVSQDTVIMFKETAAGTTPAVHYWYYPGERIGKEFVYPKDQAAKIAARTNERVLSTEFRIDAYQETYFVIDSFEQLFHETHKPFAPLYEKLAARKPNAPGAVLPGDGVIHRGSGAGSS